VEAEFSDFFAAQRAVVYRALLVATGQPGASEDALAEAFARAYERWSSVRVHPNPTAWLIRTALNAHRSSWRRWRREEPASPAELLDRATVVAEVGAPGLLSTDLRDRVLALSARQRQVVALRILADLSAEETAAILGIDPGTVHTHLHRALVALRAGLSAASSGGTS